MGTFFGTTGDDRYTGTAENDIFYTLGGDDTIIGGDGSDSLLLFDEVGRSWAVDMTIGKAGSLEGFIDFFDIENIGINGVGGAVLGNNGDNVLIAVGRDHTLRGNGGDDYISGSDARNVTFDGGDGNDWFNLENTSGTLIGGSGVDVAQFEGLQFEDAVLSMDGDFLVVETPNARTVRMQSDVEALRFEGGTSTTVRLVADEIALLTQATEGTAGADFLQTDALDRFARGFAGDDWFTITKPENQIELTVDGGAGLDTVSLINFGGERGRITVNLVDDIIKTQNDTIRLIDVENVTGSRRIDTMYGDENNNVFRGLNGNDVFFASGGSDFYKGGAGSDVLNYGAANDGIALSLLRGRGSEGLAAGDRIKNIERVFATNFDDRMTGDQGNNKLYGQAGDDVLVGNGGNDLLSGGLGTDTVIFSGVMEDYVITRNENGFSATVEYVGTGPDDGTDTIAHVEVIRFSDQDFLF